MKILQRALQSKKSFTLIESLVVIALVVIAIGFIALFDQMSRVRADLNGETERLVAYLRLAQSQAMVGEDTTSHGIHLETTSYTRFVGETYAANDPTNQTIELPETIELQAIALNGGGTDILFSPPHGETATYGTVDLMSTATQASVTITVSSLGTVSY